MNHSTEDATMVCKHCATAIDPTRQTVRRRTCPNCGGAIERQQLGDWTNVARISNLAEAGFLTDELVGLGIDARVRQLDDFNALTDRWTALYLIQVPVEYADKAAAQIQSHHDDDLRRHANDQAYPMPLSDRMIDPLFWRPVALIVLTGIASFVIGQRLSGQNAGRPAAADSLPSVVNQIGRPFVTDPVAGKPRHRLSFDSKQRAWSLDTDRDNDGNYDSHRHFHATGAAW